MNSSTRRAKRLIYLDHNATTMPSELVRERLPLWLAEWGNPSSIHQFGRGPKTLMRHARASVAAMLGADPLELIFTSGGSEANNLALKGVFDAAQFGSLGAKIGRTKILISDVEHPSVRRTAEYLKARGALVETIPVSRRGEIDLQAYRRLLGPDVLLVSVMFANNETGNVFPIREMAALAHEQGALFHSDCVQALGKVPLNVRELGIDLATFSAHKFYALKGAGVLYAKRGTVLESLIHGGGQERHRRGGTENLLAIAAFGAMCELRDQVGERAIEMQKLRNHFEARILREIPEVTITGIESSRLPNSSSLVLSGVDGETLLMNLDLEGFAVSTGAACSSGSPEPSPVLLAMGLKRREAQASLRIGLGWGSTLADVDLFADVLARVVAHLRTFNRVENARLEQLDSLIQPARESDAQF